MRDDNWLLSRLDCIWSESFSDIPQVNPVFICFGRFARLRFGSIRICPASGSRPTNWRATPQKTIITITGMFKDEKIPQVVVDHTIAYELCHYAHGFSSPHKRMHKYPHEGGVVALEMKNRGLIYLINDYKKWIKGYKEELKVEYQKKRGIKWRILKGR